MRLLRLLAWRPLRRRPLRALLAIVAVAAGTAMAVSILVVRSSVADSVQEFGETLAGPTELRVVGAVRRGGLEPDVVDRVARTEGVAAAIPVVQAVTFVDNLEDGGDDVAFVLGVDCRVEQMAGDFGCTDEKVADHGDVPLAVGPGVPAGSRLHTDGGMVTLPARPVFEGLVGLGANRFVVYPLPAAQRLFTRGDRHDVVYVSTEAGADVDVVQRRLEDVVGEQNSVLDASQGPPEVELLLSGVLPIFSLLGLFGLGIGGLLVYNTVTLSLEERRRELAVTGALGGTRTVIGGTAFAEAAVLGVAGGLLGAVGGRVVAAPIVESISGFTRDSAAIPVELHVGPGSLLTGAVLGLVTAIAATVLPVRRAWRAAVAEELSGRRTYEQPPAANFAKRALGWDLVTWAGCGLVLLARRDGGLEPWQVPVGGLGFAVVAVSLLLVGANLAPIVIRPLARVVHNSSAGRLAVANLLRAPGRTGVMVIAIAGATATAFVTAGFSNGVRASLNDQILDNMDGVAVSAVSPGPDANLDVALPSRLIDALAELPGVADVRQGASVLAGGGRGDFMVVSAHESPWVLRESGRDLVAGSIDPEAFADGEVVVNTLLARAEGVRPGDTVALPTPTGMVDVRVQAVVEGGGLGGREAMIPWELHRRLYGELPARAVNLLPEPGVSYEELAERVWPELAATVDGAEFVTGDSRGVMMLFVDTPADAVADAVEDVEYTMLPFWTLQRGLLGVSFVAVLSTLLLAGVQRRREMGMLAAVGMTPPRLAQMVLAEAGIVGLVGVALGTLGGIVTLWAMLQTAPLVVGFSNPFRPDWSSVVTSGGLAVVVALAAAVWPARRAARTEVIPALRYE